MLGRTITDPDGVEGAAGTAMGLGLLEVETVLGPDKSTRGAMGRDIATGETIAGYEIHLGTTSGPDCSRAAVDLGGRVDGARSADGRVVGTYVHGLFASDGFRRAFLELPPSGVDYETMIEATLNQLADHLERHIDIAALLAIAGYSTRTSTEPNTTTANSSAFATT
jgi:adenosylcobyric acid synthase